MRADKFAAIKDIWLILTFYSDSYILTCVERISNIKENDNGYEKEACYGNEGYTS